MAAPASEEISGASNGHSHPSAGRSVDPDSESGGGDRGLFKAMPVIDVNVREQGKYAEEKLFSLLRTQTEIDDVELSSRGIFMHTLKTRVPTSLPQETLPILLVHGFIAGMGVWTLNIDELAQNRQVYAVDLLGFGLSSRFEFANDARTVEQQYVQSLEEWRQKNGLASFILLGHSMGGYISCAYALKYPDHVAHLILDDPWGFPDSNRLTQRIGGMLMYNSMPYLRAPRLIRESCMSFQRRSFLAFDHCHGQFAGQYFQDYLLAINQAEPASGEKAFGTLGILFGLRAKRPLVPRISKLDQRVGVSFLLGERSFLPYTYVETLPAKCTHLKLTLKMVRGANHEVHITESHQFNDLVNSICDRVDDLTPASC